MLNPRLDAVLVVLLLMVVCILAHHWVKHRNDLRGISRMFQISDVENHETWVVASLGVALGVMLGAYL